jgi:hypothetical protein
VPGRVPGPKKAVTALSLFILRVQVVLVPTHDPLHPVKFEPGSGEADRVTTVSAGYHSLQFKAQFIPGGSRVTVPLPGPVVVTVNVGPKKAVTWRSASMVTVQVPGPAIREHPPIHGAPQPAKIESGSGVADNTTTVLWGYDSPHSPLQSIPERSEVIVPLPGPTIVTVRVGRVASMICKASRQLLPSCDSETFPYTSAQARNW